jgi:hypothetical protein
MKSNGFYAIVIIIVFHLDSDISTFLVIFLLVKLYLLMICGMIES